MIHLFKLNADLSIEFQKSLDVKPGDDLIFTFDTKTFGPMQIGEIHEALTRWLSDYRVTSIPDIKEVNS